MAKVGEIIIKVITNIILTILTIAVIIMTYSFISLNILNKDYVNYAGYTMFEVASGSMSPTINTDDLIIVKLNEPYKVGDIITYKSGSDYVTHRILKIDEYTGVITAKGDANNVEDKAINKNTVIGKVIKIMPKLGIWKKVIITPKVMILSFITLVLFNFAFSYNLIKKKKQNKQKKEIEQPIKEVEQPIKEKKQPIIAIKKKFHLNKFHLNIGKKKEKLPFRK